MRTNPKLALFLASSLVTAAAIVACVGDDPSRNRSVGRHPRVRTVATSARTVARSSPTRSVPGTDSGVDSGPGVDSAVPPLDVRTLPGLRLWLESTSGLTKAAVGTDLVSWRDGSGYWADGGAGAPDGGAHTAIPIAFSGGGAVYPGVVANGIAGRPSVTFESGPKLGITNHDDFNPGPATSSSLRWRRCPRARGRSGGS